MRKWAIFMCAASTGTFASALWRMVQQHSWWFAIVYLLLSAGFALVAWYHLDKLEEGRDQSLR